MSITLCALRLEIASDHQPIDFENYFASKVGDMASGGPVGDPESGHGRRKPQRHHDRRAMSQVTVETVIPELVEAERNMAEGVLVGSSASREATSPSGDGRAADTPGGSGASPGPGGGAETDVGTVASAAGEREEPAVGGTAGGDADYLELRAPPTGGAQPGPHDQDVLIGPSGTAVSYAELVRSGREPSVVSRASKEPSVPPHASKEGTPAEEPPTGQKPFISGNPFVEVTKGLLHLYKENTMTSLDEGVERSEMVCMMSVPAKLTIHDLLQFTAACYPDIERMRIIRDSTPNQYMVLIKFKEQEAADSFYRNFNGVRYNSMEPETCHLVYVSRVDVVNESDEARLPVPGFTELPTCPVCLERMDESVDGILTVLCNHSFHGSCLRQWGDTSCPVCRYVQTPELVEDNFCFECQANDNLWICLICGHVGCGRYVGGHAYSHFLDTGHTYTMQVGSTRVWDYVGDNFVHRLVQNKEDGKMVEVDDNGDGLHDSKHLCHEEKLEGVQLEYTYLLTSQLQSQRLYYEECIARLEKQGQQELEELKERTRQAVEETMGLKERLDHANKEKQTSEKKVQQLSQRLNKCLKELQEERAINKSMHENQTGWHQQVSGLQAQLDKMKQEKEQEIGELRDQVRDLMFYLEAQQRIASSPGELQQELAEGNIVVPEQKPTPPGRPTGARRKKR